MRIAIIGANGYIGQNLIKKLLKETNYSIKALSRSAESIRINSPKLKKYNVDVLDSSAMHRLLKDCDIAYYLIHMMGQNKIDFETLETKAAKNIAEATKGTNIQKIIYLSGLGKDSAKLSKHLSSRHNTGRLLKSSKAIVIEFRASIVIGEGSISYDFISNVVDKLPIVVLPKCTETLVQPIGLGDVLTYLVMAAKTKFTTSHIIEIGGPEQMSYEDLMKRYAKWSKKRMLFFKTSLIPISLFSLLVKLFAVPYNANVVRAMLDSLAYPMLLTDNKASTIFPKIKPKRLEEIFT